MTNVPSVPFVDAFLLFRDAGDMPLQIELIARRLYISESAAQGIVMQLQDARIVQPLEPQSRKFCYGPGTTELGDLLDLLASFYRTHLLGVTDIVLSKSARMAREFASAFKLKKER